MSNHDQAHAEAKDEYNTSLTVIIVQEAYLIGILFISVLCVEAPLGSVWESDAYTSHYLLAQAIWDETLHAQLKH